MIPHTVLDPELTLDYLGIAADDRQQCKELLQGPISPPAEIVQQYLLSHLGSADGSVPELGTPEVPVTERDWLEAMVRFVPAILLWHAEKDIPDDVSRDTLADFGRNLAINRRVHGRFGMDTYKWLTNVFSGRIYQLGRLQFLLHQPTAQIPGVGEGEWVLGVHIPEAGGLGTALVAESFATAATFFSKYFPQQPVKTANCESWLLDPYLSAHLDKWSNIAAFAALFTPYGTPRNEPTDAVYFTFRTRTMDDLHTLPRETALQRLVLDRIVAGDSWQLGFGYLLLS